MQSTPRTITTEERRLVLLLSRVAWRTLRRWERGDKITTASEARIGEALAQVRSGAGLVLRVAA